MHDIHDAERALHASMTAHFAGDGGSGLVLLAHGFSFDSKEDLMLLLGAATGTIANLVSVIADITSRHGDRSGVWSEFLVQQRLGDIRNGRPT